MNRIRLMAPLLAALLAVSASAQEPAKTRRVVSLKEAMAIAAQHGPDVAAAQAQAGIAHAGVRKAWTAWQPDISASGTYDHTDGFATLDFSALGTIIGNVCTQLPTLCAGVPPGSFNGLSGKTTIVGQNNLYGNVQLVQPLLTPQGLFGPGAAAAGAEAADRGADEAREQVLLGVARAYLAIQGLYGLVDAAKDAEKVAMKREDDAKARIAAGTDVEIGLLRAQTETAQARSLIASTSGQIEALLPLLEALAGEPIQPQPASANQTEFAPPAAEASEPWENAYSVRASVLAAAAVQKQSRIATFAWLPSIAGIAKENYTSNEGFTGKNWTYDLMINVSLPLYDRGMRYAQQHEDDAKIAQAVANLASARARARASWIGAKANLAAAQAVLQQNEAQVQLATRAQAQVDVSARAGVATSLDLSDADQRKYAAQSAAVQARTAVAIRRAEMAAAEGRLYELTR